MRIAPPDERFLQAQRLQRAGRTAEAALCLREILRADPRHFGALVALGTISLHAGRLESADRLLAEALKVDPEFADGLCLRGIVLLRLSQPERALALFDRALTLRPGMIEALCNRGTALQMMRRLDEALAAFDAALAANPEHAMTWNNRGSTLVELGRLPDALDAFERALALAPMLTEARENREKVMFAMGKVARPPTSYLRRLFDDFAPHYDDNMLKELGYSGHLLLRALYDRLLQRPMPPLDILDLGTGTGLAGQAFCDLARGGRLDGIDLSPAMIKKSRARGVYDDLILGDLESFLAAEGRPYDLILAADTLVYLGDLAPTLDGVFRRLKIGGVFLFLVERKDGMHWDVSPKYRCRHSESYLKEVAAGARLDIAALSKCSVRTEDNVPVEGLAAILTKGP